MRINWKYNTLFLALLFGFLISCQENSLKENSDLKVLAGDRVDFVYNDSELIAQYLITGSSDTIHTIIYENEKIIFNEGGYISVVFTMLTGTRDVLFEVSSINIDSLSKVFFIREFQENSLKYEPFFSDQLDSTYTRFVKEFDSDTSEILLGIIYGDDNGALFERYLSPISLDFKNRSIIESGRDIFVNPE